MFTKLKYILPIIFQDLSHGAHKTIMINLAPCIHLDLPFAKYAQNVVIFNIITRKEGKRMFVDSNKNKIYTAPGKIQVGSTRKWSSSQISHRL